MSSDGGSHLLPGRPHGRPAGDPWIAAAASDEIGGEGGCVFRRPAGADTVARSTASGVVERWIGVASRMEIRSRLVIGDLRDPVYDFSGVRTCEPKWPDRPVAPSGTWHRREGGPRSSERQFQQSSSARFVLMCSPQSAYVDS
jgi:hypothetical protein